MIQIQNQQQQTHNGTVLNSQMVEFREEKRNFLLKMVFNCRIGKNYNK